MFRKFPALVVKAALIVGTLDILAACVLYYLKTGNDPAPVFKFIASGVFGQEAFSGGDIMIFYGFLFHYFIALTFTLFFFMICELFPTLPKAKVATGIGYGIAIWAVMNLLVLPISNTPKGPFNLPDAGIGILILIGCVGLPLSFMVSKSRK